MSRSGRWQIRPVLYPAGLLVGFVLFLLVQTGVSPYAAGRPMLIALVVGLILPWVSGLVTGDRDRAGVLAVAVVMLMLAGQQPVAALLLTGILTGMLAEEWLRRRRPAGIRWPAITRAMTAVAAVVLVAVGIAAIQGGRILQIAQDAVAEAPIPNKKPAAAAGRQDLPSVYLILLDGYPRADKLAAEFGIDNAPFLDALRSRGFTVAERSRANHVATDLTLASMFSGTVPDDLDAGSSEYRPLINDGAVLDHFRALGYEVVSFSSGFEGVSLRRADRFVDSGQLNEFEWELLQSSGLAPVLDLVAPTLLADQHRARILATLDGVRAIAGEPHPRPRFVFAHIMNPHSPQVFDAVGRPVEIQGFESFPFDDSEEHSILGPDEYARRLRGQIGYLNRRVVEAVDVIVQSDDRAVVAVFSDHGSGIRELLGTGASDVDLRTANLLAVRSPGAPEIIDDRSTLANLLPRIIRMYAGAGPPDVPETILGQDADGRAFVFDRPD